MSNKNGKVPLAQKQVARPKTGFQMDDIFGNMLGVDPSIQEAIKKSGRAIRWISAPKLAEFGGYHARGWRPIKLDDLKAHGNIDAAFLQFGKDVDGYLRRGDCILAVRPIEIHEKHQAYLKQEADLRKKATQNKAQAAEIRKMVEGLQGVEVTDGYDDDQE
jgi:hypothetical protein